MTNVGLPKGWPAHVSVDAVAAGVVGLDVGLAIERLCAADLTVDVRWVDGTDVLGSSDSIRPERVQLGIAKGYVVTFRVG